MTKRQANPGPWWCVDKGQGVGDHWYLFQGNGMIMSREEWEQLKERVDTFFSNDPDNEIAEHDRAVEIEEMQQVEEEMPTIMRQPKSGYIYLARGVNTPWFKIGQSKHPIERMRQIGARSPFQIEIIGCYYTDDVDAQEEEWHEAFALTRAEGEWFILGGQDVNLFLESCRRANDD